ncbi:tyrosine-type recombinase/integrase [Gemmatimonas sp.]|uniref:tyrosine-type recombinase/integrase n=1 Tax=Gemmatimonas sp. TaxID=1962908 RepID=UPI0035696A44
MRPASSCSMVLRTAPVFALYVTLLADVLARAELIDSMTGSIARAKSAAKSIGIDSTTHDLRHHCASVLISSGVSIKAVQQYLGHKNASETLDTYGHLMPGDDDRVRAAIDTSLRQNVQSMCDQAAREAG